MIRRIDLRGRRLSKTEYQKLLPRGDFDVSKAMAAITPILDLFPGATEASLLDLCEKFDGVRPKSLKVKKSDIDEALKNLDSKVKSALLESIARVRKTSQDQMPVNKVTEPARHANIELTWRVIERVGLYVPGGLAAYPSSVIMNVVPAQVAGVKSIALASPPQKEFAGLPHPVILAVCALLGVDEIYAIGGAQAVALFAYGIDNQISPVDMVTGPGNIYVAAAKRSLRGVIGIDSEAGPTEILVIADKSAVAREVAADLISQAEHDEAAAAILVTDSPDLLDAVEAELVNQVALTKHKKRITTALSSVQSALVLTSDIAQAVDVANVYAAEHLEIQTEDAGSVAKDIINAGAIFLGRFTPVSLGDYSAGSNHVLPTGGCACHSSGLSVQTFLKGVNVINYSQTAFNEIAQDVITLANAENLPAHGSAISIRLDK
ncbi:MAG: histidinol dehydrogenase [Actinomycetota bacterium]|nr:histidinol dehydrogenase [Actinomycetota bacterium]